MAWFDDADNSVGALSVRLTGDAANVQGVSIQISCFIKTRFLSLHLIELDKSPIYGCIFPKLTT